MSTLKKFLYRPIHKYVFLTFPNAPNQTIQISWINEQSTPSKLSFYIRPPIFLDNLLFSCRLLGHLYIPRLLVSAVLFQVLNLSTLQRRSNQIYKTIQAGDV